MKPVFTFLLVLCACATTVTTTVPFDPAEVAFINRTGPAKISGQSFLRQAGGGVVTCAGNEIELIPAGTYAKQRISQGYGNVSGGKLGSLVGLSRTGIDPRYLTMKRTAVCDAQGNFEFTGVADGEYYLLSSVRWVIPGQMFPEGGTTVRLIKVTGGQSQRVIIS